MHGKHRFSKRQRLQHGYEFRRVYDQGRSAAGRLAVVHVLEISPEPVTHGESRRVGIVASRKVGGAVQRNRAKRLLRETYRLHQHKLKDNIQLVMIARTAIAGRKYIDVESDLLAIWKRLGVLTTD